MRLKIAIVVLLTLNPAHFANGQGLCVIPQEPYEYKVDKQLDPEFYEFTRSEFQTYLEGMEVYLRCLEQDRKRALLLLTEYNRLFMKNFGKDAVFVYPPD